MMWQTIIHITFLLSAVAVALTDRILFSPEKAHLAEAH